MERPLNINARPIEQHFLFFFLTVNQETNTSQSPGRATKKIFSVARGQMLVASGDRAPLEHSLGEFPFFSKTRAKTAEPATNRRKTTQRHYRAWYETQKEVKIIFRKIEGNHF